MIKIINYKVSGIKSIENEVELKLIDVSKPENLLNGNVAAIYGGNGAGKTALVHGFDIMKSFLLNSNYLSDSQTISRLNELINKKSKEISISAEFAVLEKSDEMYYFDYSMKLRPRELTEFGLNDGNLPIDCVGESYVFYKAGEFKKRKKDIYVRFDTINGTLETSGHPVLSDLTRNLLNRSSVYSAFTDGLVKVLSEQSNRTELSSFDVIDEYFKINKDSSIHETLQLLDVMLLGNSLEIMLEEADEHEEFIRLNDNNYRQKMTKTIEEISHKTSLSNKLNNNKSFLDGYDFNDGVYSIIISKSSKESFYNNLRRKSEFIRLFKPELVSIDAEELAISDDKIKMKVYFEYKGYKVFGEFESIGTKKLYQMHEKLTCASSSGVLVVDELDSHIHDVALMKLIEYFSEYGVGQIILTTHNLVPMEVLSDKKNCIFILSNNNTVYEWKKYGNSSLINTYRNGKIPGSRFNFSAEDFLFALTKMEDN